MVAKCTRRLIIFTDPFDRTGHIRLADLGLAKVLKSKVDRTSRYSKYYYPAFTHSELSRST